mmetsp:Transcript_14964/g.43156  ORF Transcript_14964/g.43156 Transcript_14964/m.43156 type:complete len:88 (+) Transcript_14964:1672-1935(+)
MTTEVETRNDTGIANEKDTMVKIVVIAGIGRAVEEVPTEVMPTGIVTVHAIEGDTMNEKHITETTGIGITDGDPTTRTGRNVTDRSS